MRWMCRNKHLFICVMSYASPKKDGYSKVQKKKNKFASALKNNISKLIIHIFWNNHFLGTTEN